MTNIRSSRKKETFQKIQELFQFSQKWYSKGRNGFSFLYEIINTRRIQVSRNNLPPENARVCSPASVILPFFWKRGDQPWFRKAVAAMETERSGSFLACFMHEHARKRKTCRKLGQQGYCITHLHPFPSNFARGSRAFPGIISSR